VSRRGLVALFATLSCAPRPAGQDGEAPSPSTSTAVAPDSVHITLERTPCFGTCPVYTVSIDGSGVVHFVGRRFTAHAGEATDTIPAARVDSLVAELRAGGYFDFADRYMHEEPACGRYSTDSPSVITSVTVGEERKEIRHDYGCADAPRALADLERRIDEIAGTARWTQR
jgi:hypothetical protein